MLITRVDTYLLSLPYKTSGGFHYIAGRPSSALSMLLVRIEAEDGIVGWGEAFGHAGARATRAALDSLVAPLLSGADTSDIKALMDSVRRKVHLFGLSGPVIYAISGVDIALWDMAGKRAGQSVSQLLGARRTQLPVYASFLRSSGTEALETTCAHALRAGYRTVKLHEIEPERMAAARRALGADTRIAVDTNCPWSVDEALDIIARVRGLDLLWLEEPIWPPDDFAAMAKLRGRGCPISAGENASSLEEFGRLCEAGAVDILQPSICKVGGLTQMLSIVDLAAQHGVKVVPHCGYMGPGYLANLHLVAGMEEEVQVERLFIELDDDPFPSMPEVLDGRIAVPQGPGLGCDPDMDVVRRYCAD